MRKFLFIRRKSIGSFVFLMSIITGIKGVEDPAKTATRDSKSEDLHNNPIYVFQNTKQNLRFIQRKNGNPSSKTSNLSYLNNFIALELNIPSNSKGVSAELYKMFKSYIKIAQRV